MATSSGKVCKVGGNGQVSVTVEVVAGGGFSAVCELTPPVDVHDLEGKPFEASGIEVMCKSGARFARHFFPPWDARVVFRAASGCVSELDIGEALGVATVLAIGRALGRENSIPAKAFEGAFGSWKACRDN